MIAAPLALAGYLVLLVLIAGALAPLVLMLLHQAGASGATPQAVGLRVLESVAVLLTVPLLAVLGGGGWCAWGVRAWGAMWPGMLRGALIGIASLGVVCAILFGLGVRVARVDLVADPATWLAALASAFVSAAVISLKEELFFRGGLFTALRRAGGPALALWVGAVVYAAAHFLDAPVASTAGGDASGYRLLGQALGGVARIENLDSFVALLFAGIALGVTRLRSGDIGLCLGIHFGWVLTIKLFKKLTYVSDATPMRALAGHYDDVIGWLAALVLAGLALALWRWPRACRTAR